jgi:hypothetical protein
VGGASLLDITWSCITAVKIIRDIGSSVTAGLDRLGRSASPPDQAESSLREPMQALQSLLSSGA